MTDRFPQCGMKHDSASREGTAKAASKGISEFENLKIS